MTVAEMFKMARTVRTPDGEEMVLLPKAAFDELRRAVVEAEEDTDDVAIYDARKADAAGSAPLPAEITIALLKGDRRVKAVRKWRGLTQQQVAKAAQITQGYLSDVESGRRSPGVETARSIAKALNVPLAWIEA